MTFFAAERMLPAFVDAAQPSRPVKTSAPVRSRRRFHIIRLTEARPFEEALPEISARLENQRLATACADLRTGLQ